MAYILPPTLRYCVIQDISSDVCSGWDRGCDLEIQHDKRREARGRWAAENDDKSAEDIGVSCCMASGEVHGCADGLEQGRHC